MVDQAVLADLKVWLVDELKKHTEVDSEMLADYIITTLETDDDEAKLRENCHSSLLEILEDETQNVVNLIFNWLSEHTPKPKPVTPAASKMLDTITTHLRNQPAAPAPIETKSEPASSVTNVESTDASASLSTQKTEEPPKKKKISVVKRNVDETVSLPSSSHVAHHANLIPSEPTARSRNEDRSDRREQQHGTQYDRYDHRAGREGQGYPGPYGDSRGPMAGAMHPAMGMNMPHMPMGMGMSPQQHAQMVYEQTRMRHGGMPQDGMFPGTMQGGFPHGRGQGAPVQGQRDDGNGRGKRRREEVQGTGSSHGKGTVLFVRQIPADAETSALESHFAKFGKVQLLDRFNPTMAQVFFESHEEAAAALEAPEAVLGNRFIQLSWDKKARGLPEDKKPKKKAVTEDGAAEQTEEAAQQTEQSQQADEGQADQDADAREKKRAKFGKQSFLHPGAAPFHPGHGYYGAMPWGYDPRQGFPPGKQYPGKPFQKNSESTTPATPAAHVITLAESKENLIKTKKSQYSMLLTKCTEWAKSLVAGKNADGSVMDAAQRAAVEAKVASGKKQIATFQKEIEVLTKASAVASKYNTGSSQAAAAKKAGEAQSSASSGEAQSQDAAAQGEAHGDEAM